jgi:hypothetical protein
VFDQYLTSGFRVCGSSGLQALAKNAGFIRVSSDQYLSSI